MNKHDEQHYRASVVAAQQHPHDPDAHFNVGWWAAKTGRFSEAIEAYEEALARHVNAPEEAMTNLASVYSERLAQPENAKYWLDKALVANPSYYPAVFNRAHLAEQTGDRAGALSGFEAAYRLRPTEGLCLARLAEALPNVNERDDVVASLRAAAVDADPDVLLSLAKVEEQLGNYDAAWQALARANSLDQASRPPWPAERVVQRNLSQLDRWLEDSREQPDTETGAQAPVFIVGAFRTGSTLLEQILAAHGSFTPLGESEYWPRQIAGLGGGMVLPARPLSADQCGSLKAGFFQHIRERAVSTNLRVTDKRPDNLFHIETIATALPEARFVVTERDWRDVMLSIFATRLHPQHGYATDIAAIRSHLRLCHAVAARLSEALPNRVRVLRYETLIANPQETLRQLCTWLGEPWDANCLHFHELRNSVRTASVWQVRSPLRADRQGRWRRYDDQLRAILGSDLDRAEP